MYRSTQAVGCLLNGTCLSCGCITPDLFMANKACSLEGYEKSVRKKLVGSDKVCYPKMMGRKEWKEFKLKNNI